MTDTDQIPAWDLADRLRKSLRHANIEMQEMADYLGVNRHSVGNWVNARNRPSKPALRLWALRCGVSYEWLTDGANPGTDIRTPGFFRTLAAAA